MSKLIQRIEQLGKASPAPMGFGAAARQPPPPAFVVLASSSSERKVSDLVQSPVEYPTDAILFTPESVDLEALAKAASGLGDVPWGVRLRNGDTAGVTLLQEKGCDFIAFLPNQVSLELLQGEELGRLLVVPSALEKEQTQLLEDLPVDVTLWADPLPNPLTFEALMALATRRSYIAKPFLLSITAVPSPWELECLRNIGVEGLVLDLDKTDTEALKALWERIQALPRRKPRGERPTPYLPSPSFATPTPEREEEEEEDE